MTSNMPLFSAFLILLFLCPLTSAYSCPDGSTDSDSGTCKSSVPSSLPPSEAHRLLSGEKPPLYIDVRMPKEYAQGHVPKAVNVPVTLGGGVIEPDFVESIKKAVENAGVSRPVMIGCKSGKRSTMAIRVLSKNGFEDMIELEGGFDAWLATSDLPVEK